MSIRSYASAFGDGRNYSRSRRAQIAEADGKMPLTRAAAALAIPARALKLVADPCEWHHVGKYARCVDYYDVDAIRHYLDTAEGQKDLAHARRTASRKGLTDDFSAGGRLRMIPVICFRKRVGAQTGTAYLADGTEARRVRSYDLYGETECHLSPERFARLHRYWELERLETFHRATWRRTAEAIAFAEEAICAGTPASVPDARRYLDNAQSDSRYNRTPQSFARFTAQHLRWHRPRPASPLACAA